MHAFVFAALLSLTLWGIPQPASPPPGQVGTVQPATVVRPAVAEARILTGRVTDAATGAPLVDAQVHLAGTGFGALSNADGRFVIRIPEAARVPMTVRIQAVRIGYATVTRDVTLGEGTTTVDIALEPSAIELDEVVVSETAVEPKARALGSAVSHVEVRDGAGQPNVDGTGGRRAAPHHRYRADPHHNTESYARIDENGFLDARDRPLSTFSIDVDRASYANVRRFINDGMRPPVDAVRIEELVNYFHYDDPQPEDRDPFAIRTEVARAPWNTHNLLVRIGIQGKRVETEELPPANLVFLIDVSGSMAPENKLPLLKKSFRMLVRELRPQDRVAIVVYAGAAGLVLPSTPGSDKETILHALERLRSGGSTAGGEGIRLAYEVARAHHIDGGNNRVILATDGDFNVGASSDAEMTRLIEEKRRQGTFLTVLGFGMGNLKDSKMEAIADHGNGNYAYIDNLMEARKVLVTEMGGTLLTIAKDVKIQVEFNPVRVQAHRLIGYENRLLAAEDFNDDRKDAGELGAGHTVTALYELVPVGAEWHPGDRGVDALRYQESGNRTRTERDDRVLRSASDSDELMFVKLRYKDPEGSRSRLIERVVRDRVDDASDDLRFAASVAAFGMLLRDSEHVGDFTLRDVAHLARRSRGPDLEGYRAEFIRLVESARDLRMLALHH